jgi:hypothetical protein
MSVLPAETTDTPLEDPMTSTLTRPTTDFAALPTPRTEGEWLERARLVRTVLAADAAERDAAGATPYAEVALLKESGLVTLLGPVEQGGAARSGRSPTA